MTYGRVFVRTKDVALKHHTTSECEKGKFGDRLHIGVSFSGL